MCRENIVRQLNRAGLTRREFFLINVFYKILCQIQTSYVEVSEFLANEGVSFDTFYNTIFQVFLLGRDKAKVLFDQINVSRSGYLSWQEFLDGMRSMQVKTKKDRIDLFVKIADSDGNGLLSFDEILLLCQSCLKNNFIFSAIKFEEDPFLLDLSEYFARLLFEICGVDVADEIPMSRITEVIHEGHPNVDLLMFFCGADLV